MVKKVERSDDGVPEQNKLGSAYLELKQRYDDLVGNNLAGVFQTTMAGQFVDCNQSMARILGYADRQELMRMPCADLYYDAEQRKRFINDLLEQGELANYEITLKHRSGRAITVLENVSIRKASDGHSTITGTLIDISGYRATEKEHRSLLDNYRQLLERMRDGVLIFQAGSVRYANPAFEQLLNRTPVIGSTLERIFGPENATTISTLITEAVERGKAGPLTMRLGAALARREVIVHAAAVVHERADATQLTLHEPGLHENLIEERLRSRMAEEVNEVLRKEIKEHRLTQDELRRSRRFARSLVNSSLDVIIAVDKEGHITEFNPAASVKFGYEPEEVVGKKARMFYVDEHEYARIQVELNEHGAFAGEVRNVDRTGRVFNSFLAASRQYDEDGMLLGSMGVSRDITQAKLDEQALRASEERYRDLFEHATDLIQSVDADGRFQYVNAAWRKTLGYAEDELADVNLWDIVAPEELEHCKAIFQQVLKGDSIENLRTVFRTRDGRRVIVEGNINARIVDGRSVASRSIFRDITGIHEAKAEVLQHEAKLRALFESSEHMFWTVDDRIALTSFNRGYADMIDRLYGVRPELNRDLDQPRKRFASTAYHSFWEQKYSEAFQGRALRFETDVLDKQGQRVCNEIFLSPVFDELGRVQEVFGVGHEVTEQKEAEETVREQAARLTAIFENSANMMIWTLDRDLRLTAFNEHFRASAERSVGTRFALGDDFIGTMLKRVADNRYKAIVALYKAALNGEPQQFEVELRNRAGRSLWVENFLNPIRVNGQVVEISCLAYGITDKKEAQKKLLESLHEKEVLLKEVHHRVKNNLQIISSILNLQSGYVDDDPRMLDLLRDSQDRIRSMSFIHESLYQNKNFSSIDLANYIDGLSRNLMLSYSLSGRVALEKQLQPVQLGLDQAIPCGLILNELISNALKHAFPRGGRGTIHIGLSTEERTVHITLRDNGKGLPEGFDEERDSNLGLQLVHTLIGQLDGHIERTKGPGVGYLITFEQLK
ncbi:MAG: MEKHLA domain-containing protein [Flavobacteriales bacterium]|nr:MEKHLA domain-containing protein [Flavobacteriales bacterium]